MHEHANELQMHKYAKKNDVYEQNKLSSMYLKQKITSSGHPSGREIRDTPADRCIEEGPWQIGRNEK